jgi:hypothetical protein
LSLAKRKEARYLETSRIEEDRYKKSGLAIELSRAPIASPYHHEEQPSWRSLL